MPIPFIAARHHGGASNLPVSRIVIHGTVSPCRDGQARRTAAYFQSTARSASAHYVVDPSETVQCVRDDVVAYHAPPNQNSIGVELCDPQSGEVGRWSDGPHMAMLRRAARLVRDLTDEHHLPVRHLSPADLRAGKRGICGHVDVTNAWHQTTHTDPGPGFPWPLFLAFVAATDVSLEDDMTPDQAEQLHDVWARVMAVGTASPRLLNDADGAQLRKDVGYARDQILAALDPEGIAAAVVARIPASGDLTADQIRDAAAGGLRDVLTSIPKEGS